VNKEKLAGIIGGLGVGLVSSRSASGEVAVAEDRLGLHKSSELLAIFVGETIQRRGPNDVESHLHGGVAVEAGLAVKATAAAVTCPDPEKELTICA
jgi:hypothetical protein